MKILHAFTLFSIKILALSQNLIANGDFENLNPGAYQSIGQWTIENGKPSAQFTIINYMGNWTNALSLLHTDSSADVCQQILTLHLNSHYQLKFNFRYSQSSKIFALYLTTIFNNDIIAHANVAELSFQGTLDYEIVSNSTGGKNKLCFSSANIMKETEEFVIDNITLMRSPTQIVDVDWSVEYTNQNNHLLITVVTDLVWNSSWKAEQFGRSIKVYQQGIQLTFDTKMHPQYYLQFDLISRGKPFQLSGDFDLELPIEKYRNSAGQWIIFQQTRAVTVSGSCKALVFDHKNLKLTISTDLVFLQAWVGEFSKNLVEILINGQSCSKQKIHNEVEIVDNQKFLRLWLSVNSSFSINSTVSISIANRTLRNDFGDLLYFTIACDDATRVQINSSSSSSKQTIFAKSTVTLANRVANVTTNFLHKWSFVGANFVVRNLLGFFQLSIFYVLIPLPTLLPVCRQTLSSLFVEMRSQSQASFFLSRCLKLYNSLDFLDFFPNNLQDKLNNYHWIKYYGFSMNFVSNIWDDILNLILLGVKLLFVKLLQKIPIDFVKNICNKILRAKLKLFLFQLVTINPTLATVCSDSLGRYAPRGFHQFTVKVNFQLILVFTYVFLLAIFLLLILEYNQCVAKKIKSVQKAQGTMTVLADQPTKKFEPKAPNEQIFNFKTVKERFNDPALRQPDYIIGQILEPKYIKQSQTTILTKLEISNQKAKPKRLRSQTLLESLDNLMFFVIPFTVTQFDADLFLIVQSIILIVRLITVLRIRTSLHCFDFVREVTNKVNWLIYHFFYVALWSCSIKDKKILDYCSFGILIALISGILLETMFTFFEFVIELKKFLKKYLCLNRILPKKQQAGLKFDGNFIKCQQKSPSPKKVVKFVQENTHLDIEIRQGNNKENEVSNEFSSQFIFKFPQDEERSQCKNIYRKSWKKIKHTKKQISHKVDKVRGEQSIVVTFFGQ